MADEDWAQTIVVRVFDDDRDSPSFDGPEPVYRELVAECPLEVTPEMLASPQLRVLTCPGTAPDQGSFELRFHFD